MIDSSTKRILRPAVPNRRREVEQQLAACGLVHGPRRLFGGERTVHLDTAPSCRLRLALESLGPIFSSFGLYMSARVDLWPVKDCLELAKISDKAPATPATFVRGLLDRELDSGLANAFITFEDQPFESRLLTQSHAAQLSDGTDLAVKIIHPEAEDQIVYDVELLPLFKDAFADCGLSELAFKSAITDFSDTLRRKMDFSHEALAFGALAQDAEEYDALQAPQVYGPLSTSKVLVIEKLKGVRLNDIMSSFETDGDAKRTFLESAGFERNELARLLCEVWLRQALLGRSFPVEASAENILIIPGKEIAFTGGAFAGLPSEPQANLWDYLVSAANDTQTGPVHVCSKK